MYVRVHVDEDELLGEISDECLRDELKNRAVGDLAPGKRECQQSLSDAAFALRKAGNIALAYRPDEIRHDYFTGRG